MLVLSHGTCADCGTSLHECECSGYVQPDQIFVPAVPRPHVLAQLSYEKLVEDKRRLVILLCQYGYVPGDGDLVEWLANYMKGQTDG
jgi:hypothetical protein